MLIKNLNGYSINPNVQHINFKINNSENKKTESEGFTKIEKGVAAGGGMILAVVSMFGAFKNRKFIRGFNKTFRPYKNMLMEKSRNKTKNIREDLKNQIAHDFIKKIKMNAKTYVSPRGVQHHFHPSNGCIFYGPESRAKEDMFKWMIEEMRNAGVEIIEPKPGCKPKFDDIAALWRKMWFENTSPPEVAKQFQKDEKYKALVIDGIDEIGQPSWIIKKGCKPRECPDDIFNDSPDTNGSVEKYGLFLIYKAKSIDKLMPGTIRTGRIDLMAHCMPYADEPLELWKEYLTAARNSDVGLVPNIVKQAKRELYKRGKEVFNEMKPYLEYDRPYEGIPYSAPLKKWKNWIEYMGNRKGLDSWSRIEDFRREISMIVSEKSVAHSRKSVDDIRKEEKFQSILKMMTDKVKEIDPGNDTWSHQYNATLNGCYNSLV